MNALLSSYWVEASGWTLLHSLWQATTIAVLAEALVRASGGRSPKVNYLVYCLALAVQLFASVGTFGAEVRRTTRVVVFADASPHPKEAAVLPANAVAV